VSELVNSPRYFWRRFFAFLVDLFCASLLAGVLSLVLMAAAPGSFKLSEGMLKIGKCYQITKIPPQLDELIDGREVRKAKFCKHRPNLIFPSQYRVEIEVINKKNDSGRIMHFTKYKFITDDAGKVISAVTIDEVISYFILLIGSAMFLQKGRATPGKRLLKLKVVGQGCAICREARRFGPIVVLGVASTIGSAYSLTLTHTVSIPWFVVLPASLALLALLVFYYVVPLVRWRGAMPYDRATGFEVVKRDN
jgi:uncharacterized RDD family membrane protein YckC